VSDLSVSLYLREPDSARNQLREAWLQCIKPNLQAGRQLVCKLAELEDERSLQQLRFYWGVVLKSISEQASIGGQKYTADAWHELMKRQFIPRKVEKAKVAGKKRPVVTVRLGSTSDLGVKKMSVYLEQVMAFGAEQGVEYPETRWQEYRG
jgi:hypothetical protein